MMIRTHQRGFSLLEIMLVTVILVVFAMMAISYTRTQALNTRIDKTAAEMQQILQAAVSYYIDKNAWPSCTTGTNTGSSIDTTFNTCQIESLITAGYLQAGASISNNPWGNSYESAWSTTSGQTFQLSTDVTDPNFAIILQGVLPLASVNSSVVQATVNIPSYAYNNALSMKKVTTYTPGQSIPAPVCPANMEPKIAVSPIVVSGTLYGAETVYSIQGLAGLALGDSSGNPTLQYQTCTINPNVTDSCTSAVGCWTACMQGTITNSRKMGVYVQPGTNKWNPSSLQITATTYCAPKKNNILTNTRSGATRFFNN
jgi:prepilin-type N-terminal cleavage/methylation domain-containing protein